MADYDLVDPQGNAATYKASFLRIATLLLADWRPWHPAHFAAGLLPPRKAGGTSVVWDRTL